MTLKAVPAANPVLNRPTVRLLKTHPRANPLAKRVNNLAKDRGKDRNKDRSRKDKDRSLSLIHI